MSGVSFAKIYISTTEGNKVSTEDEIVLAENGEIPSIPESDIVLGYSNGKVTLNGTAEIRAGTILVQVIYDRDKMEKTITYPVISNNETINVEDFKGKKAKFMLWRNMEKMKPLAKTITVE